MKTTQTTTELTEGQSKAIALMQFNEELFFIIDGKIYEGTEAEARDKCKKDTINEAHFIDWVTDNLTEVEPIEADEERDRYIVLTDSEADEKAKEYILESVWAFNPSFLASFTGFDIEVFEAIQNNGRCESNNDEILSMIKDKQEFVEVAISSDGRGHFMSTYDGHEHEVNVNGEYFYIYRIS